MDNLNYGRYLSGLLTEEELFEDMLLTEDVDLLNEGVIDNVKNKISKITKGILNVGVKPVVFAVEILKKAGLIEHFKKILLPLVIYIVYMGYVANKGLGKDIAGFRKLKKNFSEMSKMSSKVSEVDPELGRMLNDINVDKFSFKKYMNNVLEKDLTGNQLDFMYSLVKDKYAKAIAKGDLSIVK